MVLTTFFVVILSAFNSVNTACSGTTTETACTTAGCIWNPGTCKAVQCSLANCAAGCEYVAYESSSCVDSTATTCAGTSQGQCVSNGNCKLTDGTCKISASAKTKCDVPAAYNTDTGRDCPEGCNVEYVAACESRDYSGYLDCENYDATVKVTECTRRSYCKWETTNGGRCVSTYIDGGDGCNSYNNSEISECSSWGLCKVSGSSCVFDSNSEIHEYCDSIDITEMSSECDSSYSCQVKNGQCVTADGFSGEYGCERYSINSVSICSLEVSDYCVVKSGKCVAGFDEICERYSDECSDIEFCKLSNSKCVFDSSVCGTLSAESYTECTDSDYYSDRRFCKVVTISGSKKCQKKTAAEWCPTLSVVKYSECERNSYCQVKNGQCVKAEGSSYQYCGEYSVAKTESDCTDSYYFLCEISQSGACVPHTPHCNMNAQGTSCDSNNAPADNCDTVTKYTCVNEDCSTYDSSSCASASNYYGDPAGCEWSSDEKTCVTKTPLYCYETGTNECSLDGCTYKPGVTEACNPNAAITDATCGSSGNTACGQAPGCFWSNTGGTCTEKSCGNSPSYALCCNNNPSCAYCAAGNKPSDCPDTPAKDPDATLHAIAPAFLILAVLWLGWF